IAWPFPCFGDWLAPRYVYWPPYHCRLPVLPCSHSPSPPAADVRLSFGSPVACTHLVYYLLPATFRALPRCVHRMWVPFVLSYVPHLPCGGHLHTCGCCW